MTRFKVLHTDADHHILAPDLVLALHAVGASVIPLEGGPEQFRALAAEVDAVLNADFQLTAELIGGLRRCRIISRLGTGVDHIDVPAATAKGIPVANVPVFCTEEVANRTLTLLLACATRLILWDRSLRAGEWRSPKVPDTAQIEGQTLGLVGFGKIARAVALRARTFGLKVIAHDPYVPAAEMEREGATPCELDKLFATSDFISLHTPLIPATRHLVNRRVFSLMKPTAILVNCARGGVVDEAALIAALQEGKLAGAGLDVFETEPLPKSSPLLKLDQVIVTPHTAAQTPVALGRSRKVAVENILCALEGRPIVNLVNAPAPQK